MQSLNVLVAGNHSAECIEFIKKSKYLNKLYIVSEEQFEGVINIKFNTFKELAQKCRALQIDVVLVTEEKWILEGISDVMKLNRINCFAVTSDWTTLGLSHNYTRQLLAKYDINVPPKITLPIDFPVLVKGDGILKIAKSMQEIISIKEHVYKTSGEIAKNVFLEKYLYGKKYKVVSVFDGKHLITFPCVGINNELLQEYSKKLEMMLTSKRANFIGFINSDLIEEDGILYNTGFSFEFTLPEIHEIETLKNMDLLYIFTAVIYQKLNEIIL